MPHTNSYRLYLRKRPWRFTDGLASLFSDTSMSSKYILSKTADQADLRAIRSDFLVVGNDMRRALTQYAENA